MEKNNILSADILDIIFEGRNKEYGAYDLRKTYVPNGLLLHLLLTVALCVICFYVGSLLANSRSEKKVAKILVQDVELDKTLKEPEEKKPEPPPPPPPPKQEPPKVEMKQFTPPKIVKAEEVKPDEIPPEVN
jgi:protein TonB